MTQNYNLLDCYVIALQCDSTRNGYYKELVKKYNDVLSLKELNLISTIKTLLFRCYLSKEDMESTMHKAEIIVIILSNDRVNYIPEQALITIDLNDYIYVITLNNLDNSYLIDREM